MSWTREPPVDGHYWIRFSECGEMEVARVLFGEWLFLCNEQREDHEFFVVAGYEYFSTPIQPPEAK